MVEHEFFWRPCVPQFLQPPGQVAQRIVPGDFFPLSLSTFASPSEGVKDPVRVIDLVDARLTLGAQPPGGSDRAGLAFYLDDISLFHIADGRAAAGAKTTGCGNRLALKAGQVGIVDAAMHGRLLGVGKRLLAWRQGRRGHRGGAVF